MKRLQLTFRLCFPFFGHRMQLFVIPHNFYIGPTSSTTSPVCQISTTMFFSLLKMTIVPILLVTSYAWMMTSQSSKHVQSNNIDPLFVVVLSNNNYYNSLKMTTGITMVTENTVTVDDIPSSIDINSNIIVEVGDICPVSPKESSIADVSCSEIPPTPLSKVLLAGLLYLITVIGLPMISFLKLRDASSIINGNRTANSPACRHHGRRKKKIINAIIARKKSPNHADIIASLCRYMAKRSLWYMKRIAPISGFGIPVIIPTARCGLKEEKVENAVRHPAYDLKWLLRPVFAQHLLERTLARLIVPMVRSYFQRQSRKSSYSQGLFDAFGLGPSIPEQVMTICSRLKKCTRIIAFQREAKYLLFKYHPDRNQDVNATKIFQGIQDLIEEYKPMSLKVQERLRAHRQKLHQPLGCYIVGCTVAEATEIAKWNRQKSIVVKKLHRQFKMQRLLAAKTSKKN